MRKKPPLPLLLALILICTGLAPRPALAARPPKPTYAAVLETLGGAALGVFLGYVGGKVGASLGSCEDEDEGRTFFGACGDKVGKAFLGLALGYTLGNPLGVVTTGAAMSQHGSTAGAVVLGFFGEMAILPVLFRSDAAWGLPAILLVPAAAGTVGYHWFADPPEESDTARRLRDARAGGALARARLSVPGLPGDRFRADLLTFRF
jgi:hypothetical protein